MGEAYERLIDDWCLDEDGERLDPAHVFGALSSTILEIGSGRGDLAVSYARSYPDHALMAIDVHTRGIANVLAGIETHGLVNLRVIEGDAQVFVRRLPPRSLDEMWVFFPDPWPKARHHKRRLLQSDVVALIADRLRPGGILHAATDHPDYAEQIAEVGDGEPRLRRVGAGDVLPISIDRPATKYESKARDAGSTVTELLWIRSGG